MSESEPPPRAKRAEEPPPPEVPDQRADSGPPPKPPKVKYPTAIKLAGLAWALVGLTQLFGIAIVVVTWDQVEGKTSQSQATNSSSTRGRPAAQPSSGKTDSGLGAGVVVVSVFSVLVGLAFGITGAQATQGWGSGFTGAGFGSIFLAVVWTGVTITAAMANAPVILIILPGLTAYLGLVGGVLALAGRGKYALWRKWRKALSRWEEDMEDYEREQASRADEPRQPSRRSHQRP